MRILCLDIGSRRVGVAISDPLKITAQPLCIVDLKNEDLYLTLDGIFEKYQITKIVVGYPLSKFHPDEKTENLKRIDEICNDLERRYKVEVVKWDERFSTKAVERVLSEENMSWKKKKKVVDKLSAVYILQGYLDFINS
ncbi:Holliday junction resolvase RuvX [Caldicellulosiruptor sp. DIB 104C]|uniref:Holliday junction resolvase RuvX n=1 Tax=Caldicellulosiruptor sp. DIB 104C TaxID=3019889 RepID=UPI002304E30F|nr:Holliday junction resolvase RuvX [Caldicellulosiruptor sp. DIB 104C]